ncbi:MAG: carbamoyltransferase HypF [Gemmatimonadaceae bacterium]
MSGIVQGVGFRPFVFTLAERLRLVGFVGNDGAGVFVEVEGPAPTCDAFLKAVQQDAPPLAVVESVRHRTIPTTGEAGFRIVESGAAGTQITAVSPDVATCDACLREFNDPADRRYRYPFINCTNCGPRFTIIKDLPYDRPLTTMAAFAMCAACDAEYHDPRSRRFHAQPNACPACGPRMSFARTPAPEETQIGEAALQAALGVLSAGGILAVKGIGGFHLACCATSAAAVATLRERKGRRDKPFAVMAADLSAVRQFSTVSVAEEALLGSSQRPIVLLERAQNPTTEIVRDVAPGQTTLGVMLPYTPLHTLLLAAGPLVMTSGNRSEEPIARDNDEAWTRLRALADAFLTHDRDIHVVCDDSVVRVIDDREQPIRRSRGYAPFPVLLPTPTPMVLGVGAELKATACVSRDHYAILSQHIGDLGNLETLQAMEHACNHLLRLFRVTPDRVACDLHPGYESTRWAERWAGAHSVPVVRVQHHHAHLAALMAEHGEVGDRPILAFTFDGTGYGTDGTIWGGEVLLGDYRSFKRVAHLRETPLPGGDAGVRHPARVALAQLRAAGVEWTEALPCVSAIPPDHRRVLHVQLERRLNCVDTSSMGRFLDAASSLVGVRHEVTYEGQAAIEFESMARGAVSAATYAFALTNEADGSLVFDGGSVLREVAADVQRGTAHSQIARGVHEAIAALVERVAHDVSQRHGPLAIGLTGGVFQNALLLSLTRRRLERGGYRVLSHHRIPPNDGGIALGQVMVASHTPVV